MARVDPRATRNLCQSASGGAAWQESEAYHHNGNHEQHVDCHDEPEGQRVTVPLDDPPMKIDLPVSQTNQDWPCQQYCDCESEELPHEISRIHYARQAKRPCSSKLLGVHIDPKSHEIPIFPHAVSIFREVEISG